MKPVLKDSDYNEVDRAECQFATTTTVLDNDTKFGWENREKRSGFFDFKCHIQYVCLSWVMMFGLFFDNFSDSAQNRRRTTYEHMHKHSERNFGYFDDLHHVHKEMHKYGHKKQNMDNVQHIVDHPAHHKHRKKRDSSKGELKR
ncbi:hypothetical protein JHK82_031761 [Glycine max]|nr:hypothetical protein JHK86_031852 [Glycine max]KAG5125024.1 hypothetical protein JHK82_031761 [Glycine max]